MLERRLDSSNILEVKLTELNLWMDLGQEKNMKWVLKNQISDLSHLVDYRAINWDRE